jgi:hypothetical protein
MAWTASGPRLWRTNAQAVAWTTDDRVHYHSRNLDRPGGPWNAYRATPDGAQTGVWLEHPVNAGLGDVTADGSQALLTVERATHWPVSAPTAWAEPGRGVYCDLMVAGATGRDASGELIATDADVGLALIWPHFDPVGRRVVWAKGTAPAGTSEPTPTGRRVEALGEWELWTADLTGGRLSNAAPVEWTLGTHRFYEPYGWLADGRLLYASDEGRLDAADSQIWARPEHDTAPAELLSTGVPHPVPLIPTGYSEFARELSDGSVLYCTGRGAAWGGMDHWVRPPAGQHLLPYQLTGLSHTPLGTGKIATCFAVSPDQTRLLATYARDHVSTQAYTVMYDLTRS